MVCWLLFVVLIVEVVYGVRLPPLAMKDGCYVMAPETNLLRLEGEAVIISFPSFQKGLQVRHIAPPKAKFIITKNNTAGGVAYQDRGRVQQRDRQLWFLPAQAADSGEYICTYRNDSYCVTGSIDLRVLESSSADLDKVSHPIPVVVGESLRLPCPSLSLFNTTDTVIDWHKNSSWDGPASFLQEGGRRVPFLQEGGRRVPFLQEGGRRVPFFQEGGRRVPFFQEGGNLMIPAVRRSHSGVYTCQFTTLINDQQYRVSRIITLTVQGVDPVTTPVPDLSTTDNQELSSSTTSTSTSTSTSTTSSTTSTSTSEFPHVLSPVDPPVITSPLNGTIFESLHGSGVEMSCKVLTECQTVESTVVMWLLNGQSVESYDGRALQGGRRVTAVSGRCQIELRLVVVAVTEDDVETELTCVAHNQGGRQEVFAQLQLEDSTSTWLLVAVAAVSCLVTVVSIFLYVLFKPKRTKNMDYILARQNSSF